MSDCEVLRRAKRPNLVIRNALLPAASLCVAAARAFRTPRASTDCGAKGRSRPTRDCRLRPTRERQSFRTRCSRPFAPGRRLHVAHDVARVRHSPECVRAESAKRLDGGVDVFALSTRDRNLGAMSGERFRAAEIAGKVNRRRRVRSPAKNSSWLAQPSSYLNETFTLAR